ncbi:GNAT family N-acetyltransferase [Haloarchaeobius sp. DFWS5]|uniref:GNAT family N-acetyltransferase n=1 Tax=Haloarchaeobius sp. DFWS5 TaxID=3446114 RepID=UPI003EBF7E7D
MTDFDWDDGLFPTRIETERLVLERVDDATEALDFYRAFSKEADAERVFEHVSPTLVATPNRARDLLQFFAESQREGTAVAYVLRPKPGQAGAGRFAGFVSFRPLWDQRLAEIGVMLGTDFWGRGYSEERAVALLELAFESFDCEHVRVTTRVDNEPSQCAIGKYLARFDGQRDALDRNEDVDSTGAYDVYCYSISRAGYESADE